MSEKHKFFEKHKEFILYATVGVSALVFNWMVYSILVVFLPMVVANAMSWGVTLICAFLSNKVFVFQSKSFERCVVQKEAFTFITSRGVTGFLEVVMQPQLYAMGLNKPMFGVDGLEAKITVCIILSIVNYLSTKLIVFRTNDSKRVESA